MRGAISPAMDGRFFSGQKLLVVSAAAALMTLV